MVNKAENSKSSENTIRKPIMVVYQVISCNLDVEKEARYPSRTWLNKQEALEAALKMLTEQKSKNIQFILGNDMDIKEYEGKNIECHPNRQCDGYYNRSYYGNYRCLTYIKEVEVW